MSDVFARVYLDEDVAVLLARLIGVRGFDAITARDVGMLSQDDENNLAYAVSQSRALVTHNRADFEALHEQYITEGWSHSGIIIAVRRPVYELAERLLRPLNSLTADEMRNQLLYI